MLDHELKLGRALDHLNELGAIVKPWTDGHRHTTRCEVEANTRGRTYFATAEQPPKDLISPIIGDILHNIRSALDNLAYALACAFTKPLSDELALISEFPIFGDRDKAGTIGVGKGKFHELKKDGSPARVSGLAKIAGWDPAAQTVVEGLQPYHRGNGFESHPLWILHDLDNLDKHRTLHVAVAGTASMSLGFSPGDKNLAGFRLGEANFLGGAIETDTPYCRMTGVQLMPIDPSQEVYMDVPITIDVAFAPGTPHVENQSVLKTLTDILAYVQTDVIPPLKPFL